MKTTKFIELMPQIDRVFIFVPTETGYSICLQVGKEDILKEIKKQPKLTALGVSIQRYEYQEKIDVYLSL
ncbi:hypothetical protein [Pleurocapsa sp. FMAR1]|uniref:hypothetical protein n=1 Tax=Pleurocapsa sp. FMAR1 TaxID=3040204 RepID=UPI0029C84421|nr:hypothetical protein [Pleurocapsa sp. FMAR1]